MLQSMVSKIKELPKSEVRQHLESDTGLKATMRVSSERWEVRGHELVVCDCVD